MPPTKKFNLSIDTAILTAGTTAEIVNAILEFLLYQRNQIPFSYATYKYYVNGWPEGLGENASHDAAPTVKELYLQRQRLLAKQTKDAISAMQQLITQTFEKKVVKSVCFLFGATTFTPKEVYNIHIPTDAIDHEHYHTHHRLPQGRLSQILLSLLTTQDLYPIYSNSLNPTNLYLQLEVLDELPSSSAPASGMQMRLLANQLNKIPPRCTSVDLQLLHSPQKSGEVELLKCCKKLQVFEDILNVEDTVLNSTNENKSKKSPTFPLSAEWWEADIVVRGFKEKTVEGIKMWNK